MCGAGRHKCMVVAAWMGAGGSVQARPNSTAVHIPCPPTGWTRWSSVGGTHTLCESHQEPDSGTPVAA